jgi:RNA polymerase sigma factor (sigma-70 family)
MSNDASTPTDLSSILRVAAGAKSRDISKEEYETLKEFVQRQVKKYPDLATLHSGSDVVQDFVERLKKSEIAKTNHDAPLETIAYAGQMLRYMLLNKVNRVRRQSEVKFPDLEGSDSAPFEPVAVQCDSEVRTTYQDLLDFVCNLSQEEQSLFDWKFVMDFSSQEIAEQLQVDVSNARRRIAALRDKLNRFHTSQTS